MMNPNRVRLPQSGFSLIELVAAIAVVAILASLVIVGVDKVRSRADAVESASQIRQICMAARLYANEHSGHLPKVAADNVGLDDPTDFFFVTRNGVAEIENTVLDRYLGASEKVLMAPGDDEISEGGQSGRNFSYSFNFLINKGELMPGSSSPSGFEKALGTVNLNYVVGPESKALVYEEEAPNDSFCVWFIDRPTTRYSGKAHIGFVDGHVEFLPNEEIFGNGDMGDIVTATHQY
ncbi:MAG: prepilin-type N-terminal cleavage/methylation domain-containing protein [Verrucomicrobiota bacterium]